MSPSYAPWGLPLWAGLSLSFSSLINIAPAIAQDEDLIVYAYKNEQSAQDIPVSISVLPADYLDERRIQTLEQLSATQPGVSISKNSQAGKVFVRGIGSQGNAGLEQSAAIFIDGLYYGRSRSTKAALIDIEQVEILKGPHSVQLGINSSAGAISIKSHGAETGNNSGFIEGRIGDYGELGTTAAYNLTLSDQFALRGAVGLDTFDGFWDMVDPSSGAVTSDKTGGDTQTYRLSALWSPNSDVQARVKLEKQLIDRDNPYAWQPGRCDNLYGLGLSTQAELDQFWVGTGSNQTNPLRLPFSCVESFADSIFDSRSPSAPFNSSEFDAETAQFQLSWDLGSVRLTTLTGLYDNDFLFDGNDLTHGAPQERFFWVRDDSQQMSQEFRLTSNTGNKLQWGVGAYWHDGDIYYETGDADRRNANNPQFIRTLAQQDEQTYSLYGELGWQALDRLRVDLGLRWTQVEKTFSGRDERLRSNNVDMAQRAEFLTLLGNDISGDPNNYSAFGREIRNQFQNQSRSFSDILPSLSLTYDVSPNSRIYYRGVEGYKAGGFNFRLNGVDTTTLNFDAETVFAHEIGLKGEFFEDRLSLAIAAFISNYKGLQQNSNRGDDGVISAAVIRNAARASSDGIEAEARWKLFDQLTLDVSAALLDAKFDDYQGADCTRFQSVISRTDVAANFGAERNGNRCSQDLSGGRLAHAPEFSSRAALTYDTTFSDYNLSATFEWFYSDGFFTSPHADPLRRQPSFHKFNAQVGLSPESENWTLDLVATNLTNKLTARQLGQDQDAAVSGLLDDPRRVSLRLRYNFDE